MDKLLDILVKNGPFAIMCGILLYLLARVLKRFDELSKDLLQSQIADTAAKSKLTDALEDAVVTVKALEDNANKDRNSCRSKVGDMIARFDSYLSERELEKAREEGRREATDPRFKIPLGEGDDKRRE